MTCKTCGATTGWVQGVSLERANESKLEAMKKYRAVIRWLEDNQPDVFQRGLLGAISGAELSGERLTAADYMRQADA